MGVGYFFFLRRLSFKRNVLREENYFMESLCSRNTTRIIKRITHVLVRTSGLTKMVNNPHFVISHLWKTVACMKVGWKAAFLKKKGSGGKELSEKRASEQINNIQDVEIVVYILSLSAYVMFKILFCFLCPRHYNQVSLFPCKFPRV